MLLCNLLNGLSGKLFEDHGIFFHDVPMRVHIEALGIKTYQVFRFLYMYDLLFWFCLCCCIKIIRPDRMPTLL
jgi:hypothetical protein